MTTSHSPLSRLKAQADGMAQHLKAAERGEFQNIPNVDKFRAARARESVKFAVVMDDKILSIEMTWVTIKEYSEVALSEYILKYMRDRRSEH